MKALALLVLALACAGTALADAQRPKDDRLHETLRPPKRLCGAWRGVGEGLWGTAAVERAYKPALDGRFIQGRGQSVYPKQERNPKGETHSHLDMFSHDARGTTIVFRQFDNQGFASTYRLRRPQADDDTSVFDSYNLENVPEGWKAGITTPLCRQRQNPGTFELATKGPEFRLYLTNNLLRSPDSRRCR